MKKRKYFITFFYVMKKEVMNSIPDSLRFHNVTKKVVSFSFFHG